MRKRAKRTMLRIYLINFVVVLVLAGNASAIDWDGGGGAGNRLWSWPANWAGDIVPTSADAAVINVADANCLINSTVTAACSALTVGLNTGPCYLNMTGGTLASSGTLIVGSTTGLTVDTNGVFIMSGGTARTTGPDARLWIGMGVNTTPANNAVGTFIMTGGVMDVNGTKIEVGKNASGVGRMYISGGTLKLTRPDSSADFEIAKYGNATIVMTAGDVNILDTIKFVADSGTEWTGTAHMDLYGGTIYCGNFYMGSKATMDITEGRMRVESDAALSRIQGYANNGWIKAYGGGGIVDVILTGGGVWVTGRLGDPNLAWGPSPGDRATVQWTPAGPTLSWNAGKYAASHDVYFGASSPPGFKINQVSSSYSPGPLDLGKTYYWRIDEVNTNLWAPPGSPWQGPVWQFTMANYLVVDDMEDYNSTDAIYETWLDGLASSARGGSVIGYRDNPPYVEQTFIYGGKQSMPYYYNNSGTNMYGEPCPCFSEAEAAATGPDSLNVTKDWTAGGIKALVLYFYGNVDNAAGATERMYVALKDNANKMAVVYYNGDSNDVKEPEWHEWNIRLKDFNDINDVNLADVSKVYIGFGNRYNHPDAGGSGLVFFDEIRLYITRCVPSLAPLGDVDNDCDVDYVDVNVMAGDWLEKDYTGVGSDGVLHNFDGSQWVTDASHGRCLAFDGVNDWVDLDDSQFSNFHNKTISLWVKIRAFPSSYPYIFFFTNGAATNPYRIYIQTHGEGTVRARFMEDYTTDFNTGLDVWRHMAFVLRDTADGKCTGEFYGDGFLSDFKSGRPRHSGGATGVNLGSSSDGSSGFLNAVYDDFRVYDRALSETEIWDLANGAGPTDKMMLCYTFEGDSGLTARNSSTYEFNRPLLSPAELYAGEPQGSRVVNFRDYAILADSWLEEQLFPQP